MGSQLPDGIAYVVAGVLFYSFVNLFAVLVVIWLTWGHNERLTYVACLSYLVCLAIVASIIQQFHDALYWEDVVYTQFKNLKLHPDNPKLVIANSPAGLDLGLFYIQFYVYNSASLLAMSWSIQLSQKVFGLAKTERSRQAFSRIDHFGKAFSFALPIVTISCLSVRAVQKNRIGFIILADISMILGLTTCCILLLAILVKYIQSRRQFLVWSSSHEDPKSGSHGGATCGESRPAERPQTKQIYDRWLLVRFSVTFVMLMVLQVSNIIFQVTSIQHSKMEAAATKPDLSSGHARSIFVLFMPGVSPGLLLFLVFGLTRTYREHMYMLVVPRRWQRRLSDPEEALRSHSQIEPLPTQSRTDGSMATLDGIYTPGKDILLESSLEVISLHVLSDGGSSGPNDKLRLLF